MSLLGLDFSARGFPSGRHSSLPACVRWSDSYLSQRGEIVVAITVPLRGQAAADDVRALDAGG
jgi:hypothetical protein